jgi:hypothetical protein
MNEYDFFRENAIAALEECADVAIEIIDIEYGITRRPLTTIIDRHMGTVQVSLTN